MKIKMALATTLVASLFIGCDSDSKTNSIASGNSGDADLIVSTLVDQQTGFVNAVSSTATSINNSNGLEVDPSKGVFSHNGYVYITGSLSDSTFKKYSVGSDNSLKLEAELNTLEEGGNSIPTTPTFVNNEKAYLPLAGTGEVLDINLVDFTINERIDLTPYAMDENLVLKKDGGTDSNPEPSAAVIRDGKLYVGLGQVNTLGHNQGAFMCRGKASVAIIDIATNEIEKHIDDNRTCTSGSISPGATLTLDDNGDIYVNNTASFGYHPDPSIRPGYLRIKSGETEFDPDYFFNVGDYDLTGDFPTMDPSMARASYVYYEQYSGGDLYITMFILGLTTLDPNDFIGNKNYQPYKIDLVNKTMTKLDMLPTNGWSAKIGMANDTVVFPEATNEANGIYNINEKTPFMTTQGQPLYIMDLDN